MRRQCLPLVVSPLPVLALLAAGSIARADDLYTYQSFDVPDSTETIPWGINSNGQVVGGAGSHGFLWDGATFFLFDAPGASSTIARGINDMGQIVGEFVDPQSGNSTRGFLKDGDTFTVIDVPGATRTSARGINAMGQIVGIFVDPQLANAIRGFLKDGDTITVFDLSLALRHTEPFGINNAGQIAGIFTAIDGGPWGFVRDLNDAFTTSLIKVPGATTALFGINTNGQIAGIYQTPTLTQSFVKNGGRLVPINVPDALGTEVRGINDLGQVVGDWGDGKGLHEFIATPSTKPTR
jgi:uncharacterized membrane protein